MISTRMRCLWVLLVGGTLLISTNNGNEWVYQAVRSNDLNRWIHFLAYGAIVILTFVAWKSRIGALLVLLVTALGLGFELSPVSGSGPSTNRDTALADLFGIASGILLELNIRLLRSSVTARTNAQQAMSLTTPSPGDPTTSLDTE